MKRLASLVGTAALGAALLLPGKNSLATTTYAMYLQPISSPNVVPGPTSVFQFRALMDIPPYGPGVNNGTIALTLGATVTYDPAITGNTTGTPNNRGAFNFERDISLFEPLVALGITTEPLWLPLDFISFSTTTSGVLTYQGAVGHSKKKDPNTGATLTVPAGTYTLGTFSIPITNPGTMTLRMTTPFGLTGENSAREFINAVTGNGVNEFTNDGVLVFPNDGVTHFTSLTVNANAFTPRLTGKVNVGGIDTPFAFSLSKVPALTIQLRTPGTTNVVATVSPVPVFAPGKRNGSFTYDTNALPTGTFDVAYKMQGHLQTVVPNVSITKGVIMPNVVLLAGDANDDNVVDMADFGILVSAYNGDASIPGSGYDTRADFNYDGMVDIADFGILVNNYNKPGAP